MEAASAALVTLGGAALLVSWIMLLITSWKDDYAWGLCTLFLPPLSYLYALARLDAENHNHPKERQLDFHGGLHWRFEEHIPTNRRKIDRISLFRSKQGLELREDHTFSDEEYNTYACPWHNNLTSAIVSFRAAKALKRNPGSSFDIHTFKWHNSVKFDWHSRQLMDLGLIEPGQWF